MTECCLRACSYKRAKIHFWPHLWSSSVWLWLSWTAIHTKCFNSECYVMSKINDVSFLTLSTLFWPQVYLWLNMLASDLVQYHFHKKISTKSTTKLTQILATLVGHIKISISITKKFHRKSWVKTATAFTFIIKIKVQDIHCFFFNNSGNSVW